MLTLILVTVKYSQSNIFILSHSFTENMRPACLVRLRLPKTVFKYLSIRTTNDTNSTQNAPLHTTVIQKV